MTYSMNEAFPANVLGRTVKVDVQPYFRGTGTVAKVTPRRIERVNGQLYEATANDRTIVIARCG